mgnify:CR=1 FL=1
MTGRAGGTGISADVVGGVVTIGADAAVADISGTADCAAALDSGVRLAQPAALTYSAAASPSQKDEVERCIVGKDKVWRAHYM